MISTEPAIRLLAISGRQEWKSVYSPFGSGLYIRLQASGKKKWYFRFRQKGKQIDFNFGEFPKLSLAEAQAKHAGLIQDLRDGVDLKERMRKIQKEDEDRERKEALLGMTNNELFENWVISYSERPSVKTRRIPTEKTVAAVRYRWHRYVSKRFKSEVVSDTKKKDINLLISSVARQSQEEARKLSSNISMMFHYAEEVGLVESSPSVGVSPARLGAQNSIPKDRYLSKGEASVLLNYLFRHTGLGGFSHYKPPSKASEIMVLCVLFLFYTGQRRSEVFGAQWVEINFDKQLWVIPSERTKSRRVHYVYLSNTALAILRRAKAIVDRDTRFVFDTGRYVSEEKREAYGVNRLVSRMVRNSELRGRVGRFSPHDIRRTFATYAGEYLDADESVIKKTLGQMSDDKLVTTYQRASKWDRQVGVWIKMGEFLDSISGLVNH